MYMTELQRVFLYGLIAGLQGQEAPDKPAKEGAGYWWVRFTNAIGESTLFTHGPQEVIDAYRAFHHPASKPVVPANAVSQRALKTEVEAARKDLRGRKTIAPAPDDFSDLL